MQDTTKRPIHAIPRCARHNMVCNTASERAGDTAQANMHERTACTHSIHEVRRPPHADQRKLNVGSSFTEYCASTECAVGRLGWNQRAAVPSDVRSPMGRSQFPAQSTMHTKYKLPCICTRVQRATRAGSSRPRAADN